MHCKLALCICRDYNVHLYLENPEKGNFFVAVDILIYVIHMCDDNDFGVFYTNHSFYVCAIHDYKYKN